MPEILIVSFGAARCWRDLSNCLSGLGYATNMVPAQVWLQTHSRGNPTALFFDDETPEWSDAIEAVTTKVDGPLIGIFHERSASLDRAEELIPRLSDFLVWPCHQKELAFRLALGSGPRGENLEHEAETAVLDEFIPVGVIGRTQVFKDLLKLIRAVAPFPAPVLIEGETGSGKEMAARAIHYLGPRRDKPFIPMNCGAIPDTLFENELFGHETGAFTDARDAYEGLAGQADGGTLFLDEIETLSARAQVILLRFLEHQEFKPLGGRRFLKVDVRIIGATNESLEKRVEEKTFRRDLFYRLHVLYVRIPSLRERLGDIESLAEHFIRFYSEKYKIPRKGLEPRTVAWMKRHYWPGNVRELSNVIQRFLLTGSDPSYEPSQSKYDRRKRLLDRRRRFGGGDHFQIAKKRVIKEFETVYLNHLMSECQGNVTHAARRSGVERSMLGKLLKRNGIQRNKYMAEA